MASTPQASDLTQAHRLAQGQIGKRTALMVLNAWPLLDVANLDATTDQWLKAIIPLIDSQRSQSARLAANYYAQFRALEPAAGDYSPVVSAAERIGRQRVVSSLVITGPASIKSNSAKGLSPAKAVDIAKTRTTGAALRHALNGGRDTITQTVQNDRAATGWQRVTSASPCAYCTRLAAEGVRFRDEQGASFDVHDSCRCSVEPVFTDSTPPPNAADYEDRRRARGMAGDFETNLAALRAQREDLINQIPEEF